MLAAAGSASGPLQRTIARAAVPAAVEIAAIVSSVRNMMAGTGSHSARLTKPRKTVRNRIHRSNPNDQRVM